MTILNNKRGLLAVAAGLVAVSLLVGCCAGGGLMRVWVGGASPSATNGNRVTLKHYEIIKGGGAVTYGDVVSVIGFDGKSIRQPSGTSGAQVFIWTNPDGSNLVGEFVVEQLNEVRQTGLK